MKSETEDQLNSKSQPEAHAHVVLENETPTIDVGMDDMVVRVPKVNLEVTDSSIGKMPEPTSPMYLINPSTANAGQHSGEASENISTMMANAENDESSPEDQAIFLGKLGTFYREKAMEFKPPRLHHIANLQVTGYKLWRQVGDSFNPPNLRTQNRELQLPITHPPGSSGVANEGSGYQISASGRAVRYSTAHCRLGWHEQHHLGYGEVAEPILKDRSAYIMPKRAKSLKTSDVKINFFPYARLDVQVVDVGLPADWVKINVRETVYALVPRLLRDESKKSTTIKRFSTIKLAGHNIFFKWSPYLLELINFAPTLLSAFMGVFVFMCPLRNKISKLTMIKLKKINVQRPLQGFSSRPLQLAQQPHHNQECVAPASLAYNKQLNLLRPFLMQKFGNHSPEKLL
ncbi:hypothetical protein RDI58_029012 [Solanum bulbocastanum]|uniref:Uncharacterized protein n=1 Tax=Solanum bulbocastanum TaxID=147425 RepID=A0AAN8SPN3_SOLBU